MLDDIGGRHNRAVYGPDVIVVLSHVLCELLLTSGLFLSRIILQSRQVPVRGSSFLSSTGASPRLDIALGQFQGLFIINFSQIKLLAIIFNLFLGSPESPKQVRAGMNAS